MERRDGFRMALVLAVACVGMWAVASSTTPGTRPSSAGDEHHASAPREAAATTSMFTHLGTEAVTPDGNYLGGSFVRIYDSATTGRLLVTCNTPLNQPEGGCQESAHVYKEYTTDLQETGNKGMIACAGGDIGSLLVGNTYYLVTMHKEGEQQGWQIATYDATSWTKQIEVFRPVDYPRQVDNDPMVAYVNGQIDVSSQYNASGTPADPHPATFHLFFTTDLQFVEERILDDTPGVHGSSMIYLDGVYYLLTANAYLGDLVVMMYDASWNYLGVKTLVTNGLFSEGLAFDGRRFYVAYLDTTLRTGNGMPVSLNVRLAAFDRDWNLIEDIPVTDFGWADLRQPGRPYLLLHGNRLYVSYDCDTIDPDTHQENKKWQAYVAMYEVSALKPHTIRRHVLSTAEACPGPLSPLGVLRSTDHGTTWTSLGNACMEGSPVYAVDPTGLAVDGKIVLYVVDFGHLNQPVPQTIYRTTSTDGVNFTAPQPVYTQVATMVDPGAARLPDGSFRLYIPSENEGMISATSSDGLSFARDGGVRATDGGMPGALLLPDNRIRLFLNGAKDGHQGIFSMISSDGLTFTNESGLRISSPAEGMVADDAQPVRLADGTYLMLYQLHDSKYERQGRGPWEFTELHLATSADGFDWTPDSTVISYGGTSCVVEMPDGTMYIYYVNR